MLLFVKRKEMPKFVYKTMYLEIILIIKRKFFIFIVYFLLACFFFFTWMQCNYIGATYQRVRMVIIKQILGNIVDCHVDELVNKTWKTEYHLVHLQAVLKTLRKHQVKMNSQMRFWSYLSQIPSFFVKQGEIEINPSKTKAVMQLPPSRNIWELDGLLGRLAYVWGFVSNLSEKWKQFSRSIKNDVAFKWNDQCQNTLEDIKSYLTLSSILASPIKGQSFILYIAALDYLGALLKKMQRIRRRPYTIWVEP